MSSDHAGIRVPPPLIYVGFALAGAWLQRVWPLPFTDSSIVRGAGVLVGLAAIALVLAGFRELRRHDTTVLPHAPSSSIVRTGPYRFTRNPLYLSLAMMHLAVGLALLHPWILAMLIPAVVVIHTQVIAREEAYLERAFGDTYSSYRKSVRRWL